MQKIDRRQLLKAAAATSIGVAAGGLGLAPAVQASAAVTGTGAGGRAVQPTGHRILAPNTPATPNTTYKSLPGLDFFPTIGSANWGVSNSANRQAVNIEPFMAQVDVPHGALLTECVFWVINNDANGMALELFSFDQTSNTYADLAFALFSAQSPSIQAVSLTVTPTTVNTLTKSYNLYWKPGSAAATQQLFAGRVGWLLQPGLTTFSNPRRIYGDGTVLAAGQAVTGVDATKLTDHATPSGVPVGAKAAFCAVSSYGTGAISLYPDGTADNGIGAWASQGTAGNGVNQGYNLVPLSAAGKFAFTNYFTSKAMYFDVWGFLA